MTATVTGFQLIICTHHASAQRLLVSVLSFYGHFYFIGFSCQPLPRERRAPSDRSSDSRTGATLNSEHERFYTARSLAAFRVFHYPFKAYCTRENMSHDPALAPSH